MISGLFRFLDVSSKDLTARATLRYGIAQELGVVLERSSRWGRIKAEVFCAMKSKYAMALYEMLELRRNMDRCIKTFTIDRFRELMGVKPDAYRIGFDFHRSVVEPAMLEVNGLSDMGVQVDLHRKHTRAPFHSVTMAWWRKSPEEMAGAIRERNRSTLQPASTTTRRMIYFFFVGVGPAGRSCRRVKADCPAVGFSFSCFGFFCSRLLRC